MNAIDYDPTTTYRMTEQLQYTTLAIAVGVVALIVYGICVLSGDARDRWSIEDANDDIDDLADDILMDRDQHLTAERASMIARRAA